MRKNCVCYRGTALAIATAMMFLFSSCGFLQSYSYTEHPDCNGLYKAILEALSSNVSLRTISVDEADCAITAYFGLKEDDSYVSDAYEIAQAANDYLKANDDAPEHRYDVELCFSDINDATPVYISMTNFERSNDGETLRYSGIGYGKFCSYLIDLHQLKDYTWLQSVMLFDCKQSDDSGIFDSFDSLSRLHVNNDALSEDQLQIIAENHPDCVIIANGKTLQQGE